MSPQTIVTGTVLADATAVCRRAAVAEAVVTPEFGGSTRAAAPLEVAAYAKTPRALATITSWYSL
jgi:hypothetical protein